MAENSKKIQERLKELQEKRAALTQSLEKVGEEHSGKARSLGSIIFTGNHDEKLVDDLSKTVARREGLQEAIRQADQEILKTREELIEAENQEAGDQILKILEETEQEAGAFFKMLFSYELEIQKWDVTFRKLAELAAKHNQQDLRNRALSDMGTIPSNALYGLIRGIKGASTTAWGRSEAWDRFLKED